MGFLDETGLSLFLSNLKSWINSSGNAATATKLATARSLKTNLGSTASATFDGSGNQESIPVTGTLPVANGGTGETSVANTKAGKDEDGNVIKSTYAKNSDAVHNTSNEEIAGIKSFTSKPTKFKDAWKPELRFVATSYACDGNTPQNSTYGILDFYSEYNNVEKSIGYFNFQHSNSGNSFIELCIARLQNNDEKYQFRFYVNSTASIKSFRCQTNNAFSLGNAGNLWSEVFAGTGTINTSDERLKSNIASIPDEVLDAWGDVGWVNYQLNDSIAEKGDRARIHSGLIAQRVDAAFKARGLDARRYGLFCYDAWEAEPEERNDKGEIVNPAKEAGDAYGLRYEECLCIESAFQRRRADRLEARIAVVEARLAALSGDELGG